MNTIRAMLVGAALLAAGWLGWHFGSGELKQAREELAAIKATGDTAKAEQAKLQTKLSADLADQARKHDEKVAELNKEFETKAQDLNSQLSNSKKLAAAAAAGRSQAQAEREALQKRIRETPPGPKQEELKAEEARIVTIERKFSRDELSQTCVDAFVPDKLLADLQIGAKP
jgi:chromosome segregation ATPase